MTAGGLGIAGGLSRLNLPALEKTMLVKGQEVLPKRVSYISMEDYDL